jgi:hypothetical protein
MREIISSLQQGPQGIGQATFVWLQKAFDVIERVSFLLDLKIKYQLFNVK